jgi:DNA-binding LacI/PurR family transcriptional regulator
MPKKIDGENYYTLHEIAQNIGTSRMTVYRKVTNQEFVAKQNLKVIKDTITNTYYMDEQSQQKLRNHYSPKQRYQIVSKNK